MMKSEPSPGAMHSPLFPSHARPAAAQSGFSGILELQKIRADFLRIPSSASTRPRSVCIMRAAVL